MAERSVSRCLLLVSGWNDRAVYALARAARECGAPYLVVARSSEDRILRGSHRDRVFRIRENDELSSQVFAEWIHEAGDREPGHEIVVAPTSEYLNWFLLRKQRLDGAVDCRVPLVDEDLYHSLTNKRSSARMMAEAGIRVPREWESFEPSRLPLVAKPVRNLGPDGRALYPRLVTTPCELARFREAEDERLYFPQEMVRGESRYLLAYFSRHGDSFVSSQANLAQQPGGKSIVLARTSGFHRHPVARRAIAWLAESGFHGLVMVEFLVDAEGPCFIEINPRAWGPLQLCLDHGCGIVEAFLGEALHDDPNRYRDVWLRKPSMARYLWLGGMVEAIRADAPVRWIAVPPPRRIMETVRALPSEVYLRADSWRVFLEEVLA